MKRIVIGLFTFIFFVFINSCSIPCIAKEKKTTQTSPFKPKASTFSGLKFRNIGPAFMSGRISDIKIHPFKPSVWYVCAGSGNIWKTENAGTTWTPIFDDQPSYSIGCITLDPHNPDILWVGTGENVSGRHVGYGDGIYRSLNGGKTWKNMGLKKTEHISKILIHPNDSSIIYVASEGPLWSSGGERGVFKSTDAGRTWKPCLTISKDTGVVDIALDPGHPATLYAAAYQRRRTVASFLAAGPESGIYKTTDGGKSWRKLKVGLPKGHMGKIGLAISPIKSNVVYATIEANQEEKGFYRSTDFGESWEKRNSYCSGGTGAHYYQEIYADPHVFDRVYQMDVWIHVTHDGGKTFHRVEGKTKHSDNHALAFDLAGHNPKYLLAGCDGGVYETWDAGKTWRFISNLPITQFYKLALDTALPFYNVHGGTQDNSSQLGPSRTLNVNGIRNSDWKVTSGADGHASDIDPTDPNIIYCEWQSGHPYRYDHRSGQLVDIRPYPEPGDPALRFNWDSPILVSPHSHTRIYYGAQRLFQSDDRGDSWKPISGDLTRNIDRLKEPIMGKTRGPDALRDHAAMSMFSTTTIISESPLTEGLIYVGTDDGLVQVTEDGGKNWRKIDKLPGVPDYFYVNDIKASLHDKDTVYLAVDNHKTGDFKPYLLMSTNRGKTWTSIGGDLPNPLLVWAVAEDHKKGDLLFIGAETGLFFTLDRGKHWIKFKGGLPTISFRDIEIQRRENDLVGASFGRSFYVLDDYSPLREITPEMLKKDAHLFTVKKALHYIQRSPLDMTGKANQGDGYFVAPNPPFGAIFTYYLKDSLKTLAKLRQEKEKTLEKTGKPVGFPSWDDLRKEDGEEEPAIIITVKDQSGQVVRRIHGPVGEGIHRVAWDLRYPSIAPTTLIDPIDPDPWFGPPKGPMVVPGTFTVSITKRERGKLIPLSKTISFQVESLNMATLPAKDRADLLAFQQKAGKLQRAMMGAEKVIRESWTQVKFIKKSLRDTLGADPSLMERADRLKNELTAISHILLGDEVKTKRRFGAETSPPLLNLIQTQADAASPITGTAKRNYEIAADGFEKLLKRLTKLVDTDLKSLQKDLEAAGAPWTPGRGVPKWEK